MDQLLQSIDPSRIPAHIAVIMDGNGRWAKQRGSERGYGHVAGVDSVRTIIETASRLGVRYLTLYAFSTENWNRPAAEVSMLWHLIIEVLRDETPRLVANNVRLSMIGDIDRLPEESRAALVDCIEQTSGSTGLMVNLALSYSARWELTETVKKIAAEAVAGNISIDDITEDTVSDNLSTAGLPDPDMLIRTGGELRISNFLLWQIAYSELYFTDIFWPDFTAESLYRAIIDFQSRERRFGKTSEQIKQ